MCSSLRKRFSPGIQNKEAVKDINAQSKPVLLNVR